MLKFGFIGGGKNQIYTDEEDLENDGEINSPNYHHVMTSQNSPHGRQDIENHSNGLYNSTTQNTSPWYQPSISKLPQSQSAAFPGTISDQNPRAPTVQTFPRPDPISFESAQMQQLQNQIFRASHVPQAYTPTMTSGIPKQKAVLESKTLQPNRHTVVFPQTVNKSYNPVAAPNNLLYQPTYTHPPGTKVLHPSHKQIIKDKQNPELQDHPLASEVPGGIETRITNPKTQLIVQSPNPTPYTNQRATSVGMTPLPLKPRGKNDPNPEHCWVPPPHPSSPAIPERFSFSTQDNSAILPDTGTTQLRQNESNPPPRPLHRSDSNKSPVLPQANKVTNICDVGKNRKLKKTNYKTGHLIFEHGSCNFTLTEYFLQTFSDNGQVWGKCSRLYHSPSKLNQSNPPSVDFPIYTTPDIYMKVTVDLNYFSIWSGATLASPQCGLETYQFLVFYDPSQKTQVLWNKEGRNEPVISKKLRIVRGNTVLGIDVVPNTNNVLHIPFKKAYYLVFSVASTHISNLDRIYWRARVSVESSQV